MNLVLSNYEVSSLAEFIHALVLNGKESRWRTKFYNVLAKHHNEVKGFEFELIKEYANLDDNGEVIFLDKELGIIDMNEENRFKYREQLSVLLNEELIIPCDEENKKMLTIVGNVLLDGDFEVNPNSAGLYALWCDKFEDVIEFYEK